jgi:hypothetical protein
VVGLSRSGNHAIIDWILGQAGGRTCFLNCAEPGQNPFEWARPISERAGGCRASFPGFDPSEEARGRWSPKDLLVHSYEDVLLDTFSPRAVEEQWLGPSARRVDLLIVRDPFNLFASRAACGFAYLEPELAIEVWCDHARELLGRTRQLGGERVMVPYNRWVAEPAFRRALAARLGLRFDDAPALVVSATGGGSSFDGVRFDGAADRMPVLERWHAYRDDPDYLALFTPEVVALSQAIFGPVPPALAARLEAVGA